MDGFIRLIGNEAFIAFIATYGLATVIVIFIIFIRDPRRYKSLEKNNERLGESYHEISLAYEQMREDIGKIYKAEYDKLDASYKELNNAFLKLEKDYQQLETDIHPETRRISVEQARHLAFIGLDRDLYKLHYLMSKKIQSNGNEKIENFVRESIRYTNDTWNHFRSPFPRGKYIGNLYEIYSNQGVTLKEQLEELFNKEMESNDDKITELWDMLLKNTLDQKEEFDKHLKRYKESGDFLTELDEV